MKRLKFDKGKCIGCKLCEMVCSAQHYAIFDPEKAKLHIDQYYEGDILVIKHRICNQCKVCVEVCPCHAIIVGEDGIEYYPDKCNRCGICVEQCPQGIITRREDGLISLCNLCNGDPQCVAWCPKGALEVEEC